MDPVTTVLAVGALAMALLAMGALLKGIFNGGKRVYQMLNTVEQVQRMLSHELTPNSGSSMKDQIARIEIKLDEHIRHHREYDT